VRRRRDRVSEEGTESRAAEDHEHRCTDIARVVLRGFYRFVDVVLAVRLIVLASEHRGGDATGGADRAHDRRRLVAGLLVALHLDPPEVGDGEGHGGVGVVVERDGD